MDARLYYLDHDNYPIYSQEFVDILQDIHELIGRSYQTTLKDDEKNYLYESSLKKDQQICTRCKHVWNCMHNFTGSKGCFYINPHVQKFVQKVCYIFSNLVFGSSFDDNFNEEKSFDRSFFVSDYPGFVASFIPNDPQKPVWIAIIFRGTQSQYDSLLTSIFRDHDWRTNLSITSIEIDRDLFGFSGKIHSGYVLKIKSCLASLSDSLRQVVSTIPVNRRSNVKIVLCGHS